MTPGSLHAKNNEEKPHMKRLIFGGAVALAALVPGATIASAHASPTRHLGTPTKATTRAVPAGTFSANLDAAQEVQTPPVVSNATGTLTLRPSLDGTKLAFSLSAVGLGRITEAHIHLGAMGVNGPPVAFLFPDTMVGVDGEGFEVEGTLTAADLIGPLAGQTIANLVQAISTGGAYTNIHTIAYPAGEIRGQIQGAIAFTTLNNQADPTFNQLLGINNRGVIAGYFGSGAAGHPNMGYTLSSPYGQANYTNENFPGSVQTQVIGINNRGDTAGFWIAGNGNTAGFVEWQGVFASVTNPRTPHTGTTVNQLLGINNAGIAVGFYNTADGNSHAYMYNQASGVFFAISPPGAVSAQATGINDKGDIVGLAVSSTGTTQGWFLKAHRFSEFQFPGSSNTQAFGVNNRDRVVGSYVDGGGATHGFVLTGPTQNSSWQSVDDPNAVGTTVLNGLNDRGGLVGFYTDAAGNTNGMLVRVAQGLN
jgi:hypothetical protein